MALNAKIHDKRKGGMLMLEEFKKFALKGNMVDMAVGIIIGAAFATLVRSLVDDVIMPLIAGLIRAPDFSNLFLVLRNPTAETFTSIEAARQAGAAVLGYGLFINAVIAFLIVAAVLFFLVRAMNRLVERRTTETKAGAAPPEPTPQEALLAEIRDLLKDRSRAGG